MATWCSGWNAVVELVGPHLETPGVGGDRGDLGAVQPVGGGERQSRCGRRRRTRPSLAPGAGQLAGAHDHDVAAADCESAPWAAMVCSRCSVVIAKPSGSSPSGRRSPVRRRAARRGRRSRSATVSMPVTWSPCAGDDLAGPAAVPGAAVVEDVAEPVPLGRALQRHGDDVVGAAEPVREALDAGARRRYRCRAWCAPGWCGAASLSAGRPCRRLRQRERRPRADRAPRASPAWRRRGSSGCRAHRRHPSGPSSNSAGRGGDRGLGVGAVEGDRCRSGTRVGRSRIPL